MLLTSLVENRCERHALRNGRRVLVFFAASFVVIAYCFCCPPAYADQTKSTPSANEPIRLDGLSFSARIVRNGARDSEQIEDLLTFDDGMFTSAICKKYNFSEAPYWVRLEGGRVHFLAELNSPTDGTMVWEGTIQDNALEGTMRWTKKRWYWTINAEHRIQGKLKTD